MPAPVQLSVFIRQNMEPILEAWEAFARTIEPSEGEMTRRALRDHAAQLLGAIVEDLETPQSEREQSEKSKGHAPQSEEDTAAETHAAERLRFGFSIVHLAAEYRALRASVLRLWAAESNKGLVTDLNDVIRFSEAIDQALAESITRYGKLVSQSQNMFLAILGHDLRNPLGTTIAGAEVIMRATDINSRYTVIATRIFNSGHRMNGLVNDLIDYTRTHLGSGMPISPKPTNIGLICQNVVDEMRTFRPERTIEFDAVGKLAGIWDEGRISQAISNLIGNSLQHGSKTDAVDVKVHADSTNAIVEITNQGPPIPENLINSIFDPLIRFAENETTDYSRENSVGLGLYIAREVVVAHGGTIDVRSSMAAGTTFTILIPRYAI